MSNGHMADKASRLTRQISWPTWRASVFKRTYVSARWADPGIDETFLNAIPLPLELPTEGLVGSDHAIRITPD